jgi:dolichol-phosphate mannosyltransferase
MRQGSGAMTGRATSPPPLTIVMPAYNEEASLEEAVKDVQRDVFSVVPDAELVVVDDGSRDRTGEILDCLAAGDARIRPIHQRNAGHGPALRTGLDVARGEFILLVDSDRQIALASFGPLWHAIREADAGFGVRRDRRDPRARLWLTALINRIAVPLVFGVRIRDANVPFKIVRRTVWLAARDVIPPDVLAPSLFLAVFMVRGGYRIVEREVPHRERSGGVGSIRRWRLLKFSARAFVQLIVFRWRLARRTSSSRAS